MNTSNKIKQNVRKINALTFCFIITAFIVIFCVPMSSALFSIPVQGNYDDIMEILQGTSGIITSTVGSGDGEDKSGYRAIYSAIANPTNNGSTIGGGNQGLTINSIVTGTSLAIAALSFISCIITLASRALEKIDKGQDQDRVAVEAIIWIVITAIIILNINTIITVIMKLGTVIVDLIAGSAMSTEMAENMEDAATNILHVIYSDNSISKGSETGFIAWIKASGSLIVPNITNKLIIIATKFAVLSVIIEIGIRRIFAPMAVADIVAEGVRSPGMRYFKKFLAAYLKMGVMVIISELCGVVLYAVITNGSTGGLSLLIDVVAVNFTAVGVIFKGGEYVNDALGV